MNSYLLGLFYVAGGAFYAWRLWGICKKGEMSLLFVHIRRSTHPLLFWTTIASNFLVVAALFLFGILAVVGWHWWETWP